MLLMTNSDLCIIISMDYRNEDKYNWNVIYFNSYEHWTKKIIDKKFGRFYLWISPHIGPLEIGKNTSNIVCQGRCGNFDHVWKSIWSLIILY